MSERRVEMAPQLRSAYHAGRDPDGSLFIHVKDKRATPFEVTHPDGAHQIGAIPMKPPPGPWLAYTFWLSSTTLNFTLAEGTALICDVLCVGGGGSGGGGFGGGAGGAGEMADIHNHVVRAGVNDGPVVVGAGGATMDPYTDAHGHNGSPSSFGPITDPLGPGVIFARGGGYGGAEIGRDGYDQVTHRLYPPSDDGGSGGGGNCWADDSPLPAAGVGTPGGPGGGHDSSQGWGHDGGPGTIRQGTLRWEDGWCGGGGGADHAGGYQGDVWRYDQGGYISGHNPMNGGHGRPCDIAGWPLWEDTAHVLKYIPWFAGGGQGGQMPLDIPQHSLPGYGGGGQTGSEGVQNTGGGGGGSGWFEAGEFGTAPGPAGGRGVVIIRISAADAWKVTSPLANWSLPDVDYIVATQSAPSVAGELTIAHQPDTPRNLTVTADTAQYQDCTITGTDVDDEELVEVIAFSGAQTVAGVEIFKTVDTVWTDTPTGPAHISVGIGDQLGGEELVYPSGVLVVQVPEGQPHLDAAGDEAGPTKYEDV